MSQRFSELASLKTSFNWILMTLFRTHQWLCLNWRESRVANRFYIKFQVWWAFPLMPNVNNSTIELPIITMKRWLPNLLYIYITKSLQQRANNQTFRVYSKIAFSHVTVPLADTHTRDRASLGCSEIVRSVITTNGRVEACAGNMIKARMGARNGTAFNLTHRSLWKILVPM